MEFIESYSGQVELLTGLGESRSSGQVGELQAGLKGLSYSQLALSDPYILINRASTKLITSKLFTMILFSFILSLYCFTGLTSSCDVVFSLVNCM